jgi:hypothetical protein
MSIYFVALYMLLHATFGLPRKHCDSSEFNSDELSVKYDPYHEILILNWSIENQIQAVMRSRMDNRTLPSCADMGPIFDRKIPDVLVWNREKMVSQLGPLVDKNDPSCPSFPLVISQNSHNTSIDCFLNNLGDARIVWTSDPQPDLCVSLVNMATIRRICTSITAFAEQMAESFHTRHSLRTAEQNELLRSALLVRRQYIKDSSDSDSD